MTDDSLIPDPPATPPLLRSVVAVFLLLTAGFGVWDATSAFPAPRAGGAEGALIEQRWNEAQVMDGSLMQLLDEETGLRSNLKGFGTPWYATLLYLAFNECGPEVVPGKDGWLFLERRVHPPGSPAEQTARTWAHALDALDRQLARRGSGLLVMPVPRRSVICSEFLPDDFEPDGGLEGAFHAALEAQGLATVDLRPAFSERAPSELYYRQDTHWTRLAQWIAAGVVHETLGTAAEEEDWAHRMADLELEPDKQGLLRTAGIEPRSTAARALISHDRSPALMPLQGSLRRAGGAVDAPLAALGTSYTVGENFLAYLRLRGTTPVFRFARRGFRLWATLEKYLRDRAQLADTVLLEMLVGQLQPSKMDQPQQWYGLGELAFTTVLPGRTGPALVAHREFAANDAPGGHRILRFDGQHLMTSGDGVASIRIERPAGEVAPWRGVVHVDGLRWTFPWPGDRQVVHVPILSNTGAAPTIRITLQGQGVRSVGREAARVVAEHDLMSGTALDAEPATVSGSTRTRTFTLDGPVPERAAVRYRQGDWPGLLRFELLPEAQDEPVVVLAEGALAPRGQAILDLAPHDGGRWRALRVTTTLPEAFEGLVPSFESRLRADSLELVPLR